MKKEKSRSPNWGGVRENAGRKSIWNHKKTCTMRIPKVFAPKLHEIAQKWDKEPSLEFDINSILSKNEYVSNSSSREFENQTEFPNLVSYNRFVELMPSALMPLIFYLNTRKGEVTGISFIDATRLPICSNFRATRNKVFEGLANWGKSSIGWFFGFKLHLIINDKGELLSFQITPGNVDDRVPVKDLVKELFGKLYGDKGYISSDLFKQLFENGIKFITPFRKKMKNRLLPMIDKIMLRKRSLIETVNDQLKNISQISHSRHRSVLNFMVNIIAGLIAYTHQEKKPSLNLNNEEYTLLPSNLIPSESFLF